MQISFAYCPRDSFVCVVIVSCVYPLQSFRRAFPEACVDYDQANTRKMKVHKSKGDGQNSLYLAVGGPLRKRPHRENVLHYLIKGLKHSD